MKKLKNNRHFTYFICPTCGKTLVLNSTIYTKGSEIKACGNCYIPSTEEKRSTLKKFIEGGNN